MRANNRVYLADAVIPDELKDAAEVTVPDLWLWRKDAQVSTSRADGNGAIDTSSIKVVFALMANRQDSHRFAVLDFEQSNVASRAEGNHNFTQKRVVDFSLAASEGEFTQKLDVLADRISRSMCGL